MNLVGVHYMEIVGDHCTGILVSDYMANEATVGGLMAMEVPIYKNQPIKLL